MQKKDLIPQRLHHQLLSHHPFTTPEQVVAHMGAVQAQDYAGARWALGLRIPGITEAAIEAAFQKGSILRTHVLRPTWHFVTPADIRWMLALTAPYVHATNAYYYRKMELDNAIFKKSARVITKALQGGKQLMRMELAAALRQAGIATDDLRLNFLMIHAELSALICSGARKGRQFTYALLDERAPQGGPLSQDEALARLTEQYFRSHGPATVQDFSWWSGLPVSKARQGLEITGSQLEHADLDGARYWYAAHVPVPKGKKPMAQLLPNFDEFVISYKDRSALFRSPAEIQPASRDSIVFGNAIAIDGQLAGAWKRTFAKGGALIELSPLTPLSKTHTAAVNAAVKTYGRFLEMPVSVV